MQAGAVSIYSRNSENNTTKYPDLVATLPSLLTEGTKSVVLDCEAVAFDRTTNKILPFQVLLMSLNKGRRGIGKYYPEPHKLIELLTTSFMSHCSMGYHVTLLDGLEESTVLWNTDVSAL